MFYNSIQKWFFRRNAGVGIIFAVFLMCVLCISYTLREESRITGMSPELRHVVESKQHGYTKGLVLAKTRADDVSWLIELYNKDNDFKPFIYTMEEKPEEGYLVPRSRRGRETASYLSYIIDGYDNLPEYSIFVHAGEEQWHNDLFGPRTADTLTQLRLQSVQAKGYVNLRCNLNPGCPLGVNPLEPTEADIRNKDTRAYFADIYKELFQVSQENVPAHIGNVCCGQFAVSRASIMERPKSDYERMLRWADESVDTIDNFGVGWVFEKIWHIIFGMEPTYCPRYEQCRCDNYGWCGPLASGEVLQPEA